MHIRKKILLLIMLGLMICLPSAVAETLEQRALPIDFSGGVPAKPEGNIGQWEYADPTIQIKVEKGREDDCDYWVADIRIGHASQLRTAAADGFDSEMVLPAETMAKRVNAVLAINGDFFNYLKTGFIVRQGELFRDKLDGKRDLLLIDEAGDFHFLRKATKKTAPMEIDGKKVINAFSFGPVLVEDGVVNTDWNFDQMAFGDYCQRMAIGQVGPLHYKVVCCGSPDRDSTGMKIRQFAQFVADLGIPNAYNLDGGNSTMLIYQGEKINDPEAPKVRDIADIIYFASSAE